MNWKGYSCNGEVLLMKREIEKLVLKCREKRQLVILVLFLLCAVSIGSLVRPVLAATKCTVTFLEMDGRNAKVFKKLKISVTKGKKATLPEVPVKSGYAALGWAKTKNAAKARYAAGDEVTVKANLTLYAVRLPIYSVSFNNNSGTTLSRKYTRLGRKVMSGKSIRLPALPEVEGYEAVGWTTSKGQTEPLYKVGTKVAVTKNITYYSVRKKIEESYTVNFASAAGVIYTKLSRTVTAGEKIILPQVENPKGYTMLGWAKTAGAKTVDYLVGESLTVNSNMKLHAVMFSTGTEPNLTGFSGGWQQKYKQLIFVGDSRTNRLHETIERDPYLSESGAVFKVFFISAEGEGLAWLEEDGMKELREKIAGNYSARVEKPTAVIFNLGVNDYTKINSYITFMQSVKQELLDKNCKLFYMSVNPINSVMNDGKVKVRSEAKILQFNKKIKNELCRDEDFTYLDMFSYLIKNGYSHDTGKHGANVGVDDGLHYTTQTYKRIFAQCISMI